MSFVLYEKLQNLLTYSEQFDNAIWSKNSITVTVDAVADPFGDVTADNLIPAAASAAHRINQSVTTPAGEYTFSAYFKPSGYNVVSIYIYSVADGFFASTIFDLSDGSISSSSAGTYTIEELVDGWYRVSVTGTTTDIFIGAYIDVRETSSSVWTGDGVSGMYAYGASLSDGDVVIPYILTEATNLSDASIYVDVEPEYTLKESGKKVESRHRVRDGGEFVYKWGEYDTVSVPVMYVNSSFKTTVNSWWSDNTDLIWNNRLSSEVTSVHVTNKSKPIDAFNKPYNDLFKGKIELGTY